MKLNLPAVLLVFVGVVLVYSGINHRDPRNVVLEALGSKRRVPELIQPGSAVGDAAGKGAREGAKALPGASVPNPGVRPPGVPVVSV